MLWSYIMGLSGHWGVERLSVWTLRRRRVGGQDWSGRLHGAAVVRNIPMKFWSDGSVAHGLLCHIIQLTKVLLNVSEYSQVFLIW